MTAPKPQAKRPWGHDMERTIHVRLPPEVDSALRQVRRMFGISLADQIRAGIERNLADRVPEIAAKLKSSEMSSKQKLKLLGFLDTTRRAHLALHHPEAAKVLRDARAEEANEKRRKPRNISKAAADAVAESERTPAQPPNASEMRDEP